MKKSDLLFNTILIPLDYLMLVLAGILIYYLRFTALVGFRPVIYEIPFRAYLLGVLLIGLGWLAIFAIARLYDLGEKKRFTREFSKIFLACSVGAMSMVLVIFFRGELFSSRFIILASWPASIILVSFGRVLVHLFKLLYYKRGKGLEPVLVYGNGVSAKEIIQKIQKDSGLGYKIIGEIHAYDELVKDWTEKAYKISELVLANSDIPREEKLKLAGFCNEHQIVFKYATDMFGALSSNIRVETLAGIPMVEIRRTALDGWGKVTKRLFDIVLAGIGLVILSPVFLIIGLLIKLDSPGPCFVGLERVGQRSKKFKVYKFRSMIKNAHAQKKDLLKYSDREGPLFKMANDPRITRVGKILRKTSIDELPQLVNVLKGEMSLVGPRPHEPEEVARYQKSYKQLLTIKPGITGLAQISGRSKLPFDEEAKLDIHYVENWSMGMDTQILLKTIPAILSAKNAA